MSDNSLKTQSDPPETEVDTVPPLRNPQRAA
jgi:hypothetical protein